MVEMHIIIKVLSRACCVSSGMWILQASASISTILHFVVYLCTHRSAVTAAFYFFDSANTHVVCRNLQRN